MHCAGTGDRRVEADEDIVGGVGCRPGQTNRLCDAVDNQVIGSATGEPADRHRPVLRIDHLLPGRQAVDRRQADRVGSAVDVCRREAGDLAGIAEQTGRRAVDESEVVVAEDAVEFPHHADDARPGRDHGSVGDVGLRDIRDVHHRARAAEAKPLPLAR